MMAPEGVFFVAKNSERAVKEEIDLRYLVKQETIGAELARCVAAHLENRTRLIELDEYYTGRKVHPSLAAAGRPDLHAYTNLAKYITDTATGYFAGVAPRYLFDEGVDGSRVQAVFDLNNESSVNYQLAEDMSVFGAAYDLLWRDEEANIRISRTSPVDTFLLCEDSVEEKLIGAVRLLSTKAGAVLGELYLKDRVRSFRFDGTGVCFTGGRAHFFDDVPITEYKNNFRRMGDFECALENIDLYNLTLSSASNDLQSVANAFLAICGMMGTEQEDIDEMNRTRVAKLPVDGKMEFVIKNINDTALENHKKTLKHDILQVCGVPDLTDECFAGNASGVALEFKMWGLDQLRTRKQQGMDDGLFRRLRLIADALTLQGLGEKDASERVSIFYTRNMPRDLTVTVDNAAKLNGIVSEQTIFGMVENVTGVSVEDELKRIALRSEYTEVTTRADITSKMEERE